MRGFDEGDINIFDANQSLLMGGLNFDMEKSIQKPQKNEINFAGFDLQNSDEEMDYTTGSN